MQQFNIIQHYKKKIKIQEGNTKKIKQKVLVTMCYNRNKGNNDNKNKLYTKEILKEKRLNKVFPFLVEIVNVFIFNSYLLKSIQFVFEKEGKPSKGTSSQSWVLQKI